MDLTTKDLLLQYFLEWQKQTGERKYQHEFAEHIGINNQTLSHLMSGRRAPSLAVVTQLSEFFQDERFYDAADYPRPDPGLHYLTRHWGELSKQARDKILLEVKNNTTEPIPNDPSNHAASE